MRETGRVSHDLISSAIRVDHRAVTVGQVAIGSSGTPGGRGPE
jgi:hypothetical protein